MSVATQIQRPSVSQVFLVEITAALWCRAWVLTSGKAITYQIATALTVTAVTFDRTTTLTQRASVNDVEANAGSWYHDGAALYVSAPTGTPFAGTVLATVSFWFSNKPKVLSGRWYDPRVKTVPNLSLRIEHRFGGVGQIGGGNCVLINNDRFFDALQDLQWDAGAVTIRLGIDTPAVPMDIVDYQTVGRWLLADWDLDDEDFTLKLREIKSRLRKNIPYEFYDDGKTPKPRAYGQIVGAKPQLIAETSYQVAGHEIRSFDGLRVRLDDAWIPIEFATQNTAQAQFTVGAAYRDKELSVDFSGRKNPDGTLMDNAADIIQDLLAYCGETDLNASSFTATKARLATGLDPDGRTVSVLRPTLYIDSVRDVLQIIGDLNRIAGLYLYSDATGQYRIGAWQPTPGESLSQFTEQDLTAFDRRTDNRDLASLLKLKYQDRAQDKFAQVITLESTPNQFTHGEASALAVEETIGLHHSSDAALWAQRFLRIYGRPIVTWSLSIPWQALLLMPGDQLRLTYTRHGLDTIAEVLEVRHDLLAGRVHLVVGDLRSFVDQVGIWVDAAAVLPTRFSTLTGYGAGALAWNSSWDPEIKTWARQNAGYWTDANGLAAPSDPESHLASVWM